MEQFIIFMIIVDLVVTIILNLDLKAYIKIMLEELEKKNTTK